MSNECMITVNSKKELEDIRNNSEFSVMMYRSDNCSHCKKMHPIVESRCNDVKGFVPVIDCPVDKKFCMKGLGELGKDSIPLVVGYRKAEKTPSFIVEGAKIDDINNNFDVLEDMISKARDNSGNTGSPQPPGAPMENPSRNVDVTDTVMRSLLSIDPRPHAQQVDLCVPGFNCSNQEYEDRAVAFMLSNKNKRKEG